MGISYEGIGQVLATFVVEEETAPGSVVTMTGGAMVGCGSAGSIPCGVLTHGEMDGCGSVQVSGFARVSYSGTAPGVGYVMLACDGLGGVKQVESGGMSFLVVYVDEDDESVVIKL